MKTKQKFSIFSKNANMYLIAISFFYISMGSFGMLQGIYIKELNIEESFLGIVLSFKTFAIAFASIPCAMIVNKIGRKRGILITMFLVPILTILQGAIPNKYIILLLSVLQGAVQGFLMVSEGPFFMDNSNPKNRIKLFSYSFADNVFSTMFGYFVFGQLSNTLGSHFGVLFGLKYGIIISGIIGLISCVFILFVKDNKTNVSTQTEFFKKVKILCLKPYPRKFIFYNLMVGFGAGLVVPYFNVYLKYKVNASTSQIGIIMALAQGAMGIGGLITPHMTTKFGRTKTILICQSVSIPFLMLIALPPNIYIVATALLFRNALMNMAGPVINNLSMELINDDERSIYSSLHGISNNLSRAVSALVAGYIMENLPHGYELPYFITSITYLISTIYFYKSFNIVDSKKSLQKKIQTTTVVSK